MSSLHIAHELFELIYPVGSIYMSVNETNPSILFGGEWTQIKGRFLMGVGSPSDNSDDHFGQITYKGYNAGAGSTGGQSYHVLTSSEIASHSHNYYRANNNTNSHTLTVAEVPSHIHDIRYGSSAGYGVTISTTGAGYYCLNISEWYWSYNNDNGMGTGSNLITSPSGGGGGHNHVIGQYSMATAVNTNADGMHNNMPPYFAVYMWRRTA